MTQQAVQYEAYVSSVIDGDTFWTKNKIRLARVYAPELNTLKGKLAKRQLEELILHKNIIYRQVGISFDRIVAEVWLNGYNMNDVMINLLK